MGKKSKEAKSSDASSKPRLEIVSLESLLDRILSEYIQVNTVASGAAMAPFPESKDDTTLHVQPLCHWQNGCPQNLAKFKGEMDVAIAYAWWSRTRLRYSCSTLAVFFVKICVPKLRATGIEELSVTIDSETVFVRLEDLEIMSLGFVARADHKIVLNYGNGLLDTRTETVEAPYPDSHPPHCSHNVLQCKTTGMIVDMALGQFIGTMQPYVFLNLAAFEAKLPGKLVYFEATAERAIQEQFDRDCAAYRRKASPDCVPDRFWKRIAKSIQQDKEYCANCKGTRATSTPLKRCTRCKKVLYCSRDCQKLHWKHHKASCVP